MSALNNFGQRQQSLLRELLVQRKGLTIEELSRVLDISRNAVNQHIASLESSGYVESLALAGTRGRPSKLYSLTRQGLELFPRHYDLLSSLLLGMVREKLSTDELTAWLRELGAQMAREFIEQVASRPSLSAKLDEVAAIMHKLGYEAQVDKRGSEIIASNCVFHNLAIDCQQVCELDLSLMETLLGSKVEHRECMAKGEPCCRFALAKD